MGEKEPESVNKVKGKAKGKAMGKAKKIKDPTQN